eukprot:TRINITY_DN9591_c1_g1_i1.p1 TRINITY_DN9591_c1_g1~~TRINITY_DN9591_c1_g1_i1.p1  ORF type:complete len:357 (+),score=40.68 TRINITY_DN9591_c1_g1_i1:92-1162(+)
MEHCNGAESDSSCKDLATGFLESQGWPTWTNCSRDPIPDIADQSLSEESSLVESSSDGEKHGIETDSCVAIPAGTVLVSRRTAAIYESTSSWDVVGKVFIRDRVVADGPAENKDGCIVVPIRPRGFVELRLFETPRLRRKRWRLRCPLKDRMIEAAAQLPPSPREIHEGSQPRRTLVHFPGFLSLADVDCLHVLPKHPAVRHLKSKGRDKDLNYRHEAYRVDLPLRAHLRPLCERLIGAMLWTDISLWQRLKKKKPVYPEIEYIVYDASSGLPGLIEPHVDNFSVVTLVALLSEPSDFEGGCSCFAAGGGENGSQPRQFALGRGDVIIFRGEKLLHWITPVTSGVRVVLQVELSSQ